MNYRLSDNIEYNKQIIGTAWKKKRKGKERKEEVSSSTKSIFD